MSCTNTWNLSTNVLNGAGPFTYQWSKVSGSADVNIAGSSTGSSVVIEGIDDQDVTNQAIFKVVVTDTGNGNVTSESTITLDSEHSLQTVVISFNISNQTKLSLEPQDAYVRLSLFTDATYVVQTSSNNTTWATTQSGTYATGGIVDTSLLTCRLDEVSGTMSGEFTGTNISLSTQRTWFIAQTSVGVNAAVFDLTIFETAEPSNSVTDTGINFTAEVNDNV